MLSDMALRRDARLVLVPGVCALAFLAAAARASAAPETACSPTPKVTSSFCVSGSFAPSTTTAAAPLGFDVAAANTSDEFATNTATWAQAALITLPTVGGVSPTATPSAQMPNLLRIAGGGSCTPPGFTDCAAGHGTIGANVSGTPIESGFHEGTFGILEVVNVNPPATGDLASYRVKVSICINTSLGPCFFNGQDEFTMGIPEGGATQLALPARTQVEEHIGAPCSCTITADVTLKSFELHVAGSSSTLQDGSPAGATYSIFSQVPVCGASHDSLVVVSSDARQLAFEHSYPISGCPLAAGSASPQGFSANFDGGTSSSPVGRSIAHWLWSFDDGAKADATTPSVAHEFNAAGDHSATLVVVDSAGARSDPVTVTVPGTTISVRGHAGKRGVRARGRLQPARKGAPMSLVLLERRGKKGFVPVRRKAAKTNAKGTFAKTLRAPARAKRCEVQATFAGDAAGLGSRAVSRLFAC
jgi:hypothetical protein